MIHFRLTRHGGGYRSGATHIANLFEIYTSKEVLRVVRARWCGAAHNGGSGCCLLSGVGESGCANVTEKTHQSYNTS